MTHHVLHFQLPRVAFSDEPTLVTLTIGGNDLLNAFMEVGRPRPSVDRHSVPIGQEVTTRQDTTIEILRDTVTEILDDIRRRRPNSVTLLATVYDPTDGTGDLPDFNVGEGGLNALRAYNEALREIAATRDDVSLADLEATFRGHGIDSPDCWYWKPMPIEPGYRGASEVRRAWLDALGL